MIKLREERILVISPQPWDHIPLSKHHYARELGRQGNRVFFLNPPDEKLDSDISIEDAPSAPGVQVIRYRLSLPLALRIHARPLFDFLMRRRVEAIRRLVEPLDVTMCFEFNLFADLRTFGATLNVVFPVDPISDPQHLRVASSADVILSVSELILSRFAHIDLPRLMLGHGLASEFVRVKWPTPAGSRELRQSRVSVGYAGNIARPPLNRGVLRRMVADNSEVTFHFWGPAEIGDHDQGMVNEISQFIDFLRRSPNVLLHGAVSPARLAEEFPSIDCFILSYSADATESDRSNSHKLLEYLSTGKVVVSSRIAEYENHGQLLRMAPGNDDDVLPGILADTLGRLDEFNSAQLQEARRSLALAHTYEKKVDRIRDLLATLQPRKS